MDYLQLLPLELKLTILEHLLLPPEAVPYDFHGLLLADPELRSYFYRHGSSLLEAKLQALFMAGLDNAMLPPESRPPETYNLWVAYVAFFVAAKEDAELRGMEETDGEKLFEHWLQELWKMQCSFGRTAVDSNLPLQLALITYACPGLRHRTLLRRARSAREKANLNRASDGKAARGGGR